jgi:hypothetical protein
MYNIFVENPNLALLRRASSNIEDAMNVDVKTIAHEFRI